jgi:hypothetical protein
MMLISLLIFLSCVLPVQTLGQLVGRKQEEREEEESSRVYQAG